MVQHGRHMHKQMNLTRSNLPPPTPLTPPRPHTKILFSYIDSKRDDATSLHGAFSLGKPGYSEHAFGGLGVDAVIGPASSGPAMNAQYVLRKLHVPQLGYSATSPALSDDALFPYFLRTPPSDTHQAVILAQLIRRLGWDRVATISGTDTYSYTGVQSFQDAARKAGVELMGSQTFTVNSKNVSREVLNLVTGGTRIVAVFCRASDMGTVIREFSRYSQWKPGSSGVVFIFSETLKVSTGKAGVLPYRFLP